MFRSAPPVGQNETLCRTHSETYIKVLFSFLDSFLQRTALLNDILLRSNKNPVLYHYLWNQHGFYKKCFVLPHLPLYSSKWSLQTASNQTVARRFYQPILLRIKHTPHPTTNIGGYIPHPQGRLSLYPGGAVAPPPKLGGKEILGLFGRLGGKSKNNWQCNVKTCRQRG